ncbi:SDR family oxidoreductase [Chlorobium sp. BLA1]|uniref:SDR family oxidoreductase n=1 Tax=Candidatus Chlorobium masyuteum TaxID=2716876 RepID=UPI0014215327|nr:SDR family oxidoreductase [Candidatus Chlorobium masyuteum]NHQ60637.1 SDR family oxidoreductase [Candidatus Chlorobium masyuteum]
MKKIIIITGAGKGIGRAIAIDFSRAAIEKSGFEPILILVSRTASDLESVATECRANGAVAEILTIDIADKSQTDRLVETTIKRYGTIDCLINNAGVGRFKPLGELNEEDFDYTISTNLKGTFFLTQKVFAAMEKNRSGHIFFITSIAAETAFKSSAIYCMSKFGQKGLIETLRLYARECNVRITNVMPGAVYTPMWGELPEEMKSVMMRPKEISSALLNAYFLPGRASVEELVIRPVGGDIND